MEWIIIEIVPNVIGMAVSKFAFDVQCFFYVLYVLDNTERAFSYRTNYELCRGA